MSRSGGGRTGKGGNWLPRTGHGDHPLVGIEPTGPAPSARTIRRRNESRARRKARRGRAAVNRRPVDEVSTSG